MLINVQKIYGWIIATPISNKFKTIKKIEENIKLNDEKFIKKNENSTNKWINKCPANKLALIRTLRVIGRIIKLIISIKTINGLKGIGHPCGTKCKIDFLK